jgi:leucyl/phenylalanyl-tRNA--protein transferase
MKEEEITTDILLQAYRAGLFPMAEGRHGTELSWYDPRTRGILPLDNFHVPQRLQRKIRQKPYDLSFDTDFAAVIRHCADARDSTWINDQIIELYTDLHRQGFAHSVEARMKDGTLAGGLYGVSVGGAFFGESMFSNQTDASKICLVYLAEHLSACGFTLLDAQFSNDHLQQFGIIEIPRAEYHRRLSAALAQDVSFRI